MADPVVDVTPTEPSPVPVDPVPGTVTPAASADVPAGRTLDNVVGEFNRKFSRMQEQLASVLQAVQTHPAPPVKGTPTDEELWSLAQQGDRTAFELYQERIADRKARAILVEREQEQMVNAQLGALAQRYPVFNDAQHPLTQTVQAAYQLLVSRGYPATRTTLLDAMKTAIADRPDLVAEMHRGTTQAHDATRVSATRRARAGQTSAQGRDVPSPASAAAPHVSAEQADLARRMGIKDPARAIARFKERQDKGVSSLGAVAGSITEEL